MAFEPRQHELFGLDLGDGPPRRALLWGVLCFAVWWGLLWLITGGISSEWSLLWIAPPALFAVYGWRDGRTPRRRLVTEWLLTVRWLRRGHVPLVSLGRHHTTRSESAGWWERIGHRFGHDDPLALVLPWRSAPTRLTDDRPTLSAPAGATIGRTSRAQLIGTDVAERRRAAVLARTTRRRLPSRRRNPATANAEGTTR